MINTVKLKLDYILFLWKQSKTLPGHNRIDGIEPKHSC